jgi:membrane protein DedA with SNARE-associated domain
VAAGILELPYRVFVISVAVSSSIWAGLFLVLGAVFGRSLVNSIRSGPLIFVAVAVVTVVVIAAVFLIQSRRRTQEAPRN